MPIFQPSIPSPQQTVPLADAETLVCEALWVRSKALTPAEGRRLVKTLERLHPAAHVALAGVAIGSAGSPERSFESVLMQLSDV